MTARARVCGVPAHRSPRRRAESDHGLAEEAPLHRAAGGAPDAHARVAVVRAAGPGEVVAAGRRHDVHQLHRAVPAADRGRRDRRRHAEHRPAAPAAGQDRRAGPRHLRPARHRLPGGQRGHHRSHRRCRPAVHRHRLGRLDAGVPARGVGAARPGREPPPAQTHRHRGADRPGRRRPRDDRRLHRRLRPGRLDQPRTGPGAGRLGRGPAAHRGVRRRRVGRLPASAVRPDAAARRRTPAPPASSWPR